MTITRTENASKLFALLLTLGVFTALKSVGVSRYEGQWEVWGHFQDENGRRNGLLAQFADVTDAVDFEVLCEGITR